jgi:hypothetical protein
MKTTFALMTVLLSACLVRSFHPFYTEDAKIELPAINGEWKLTKS